MITGDDDSWYSLTCDECGEDADEAFETFYEAVEWKKDRDNGWRAVKGMDDEWHDLCPTCNNPVVIAELRGEQ
jgi:hypothetical protein